MGEGGVKPGTHAEPQLRVLNVMWMRNNGLNLSNFKTSKMIDRLHKWKTRGEERFATIRQTKLHGRCKLGVLLLRATRIVEYSSSSFLPHLSLCVAKRAARVCSMVTT
ncbi:hypothetical protein FH972_022590 [Carpinus fangiana]|uniref:Uncharacterized protein n=1 Tax=Carpinus fangiana TaxID=176857 RepID=A0A5N6KTC8_9ROSI|nr:hypothetical protein FH972_022590 [Carpinus fangiana]